MPRTQWQGENDSIVGMRLQQLPQRNIVVTTRQLSELSALLRATAAVTEEYCRDGNARDATGDHASAA